ncbi:hypothetical protein [Oribacterium sp. P6A1]|uniref:hypothetical protein n=1 Tax=Oribacterium sp. P6A1 TaxID=1410612 RepID=UPI00056A9EBF|nr:hypothetical protein [Oribacterium sp. P6A1]
MQEPQNERKSVIMNFLSMLIFGTIGIFRRHIPVSSAFLSFSRGLLGGIFILIFMMLFHRTSKDIIKVHTIIGLVVTGALMGMKWMKSGGFRARIFVLEHSQLKTGIRSYHLGKLLQFLEKRTLEMVQRKHLMKY